VVRLLGVIGLLTLLVAFIRTVYPLGIDWLITDLWVGGAILVVLAILLAWFWKDSKNKDTPSSL
jgi:hypothetical protein